MMLAHLCSPLSPQLLCCRTCASTFAFLHQKSSVKRSSVSCPTSSRRKHQTEPFGVWFPLLGGVRRCFYRAGAGAVALGGRQRVRPGVRRGEDCSVAVSAALGSSCFPSPRSWKSRNKKCPEICIRGLDPRASSSASASRDGGHLAVTPPPPSVSPSPPPRV